MVSSECYCRLKIRQFENKNIKSHISIYINMTFQTYEMKTKYVYIFKDFVL